MKVKVSDTKYRRSPLIQGGLEIPVEVEVQMENSSENQQALSKYQTLVAENYHESVNFYMFYCHRKSFEYLTLIRKKVSACEIAKIK